MRFIVIEGLDGSGKGTQFEILKKFLGERYRIKTFDFPNYNTKGCSLVSAYLNGELASSPDAINAYAASMFFASDRYITMLNEDYSNVDFVLANRYTTSNAIYQCCKLKRENWDIYTEWLFDLEYNKLNLLKPTDVIFLRVPIEISQELMLKRYSNDVGKKDIHEKDIEYLEHVRKASIYVAEKYNWNIIDCVDNNNKLLSIEEIQYKIRQVLKLE